MNISLEVLRFARITPDVVAVQAPERTLTFAELDGFVRLVARCLHRHGLKAGDVVGLCFDDEAALLVAVLATAHLGATAFSIPLNSPPLMQQDMAKRAGVNVLVSCAKVAGLRNLRQIILNVFSLSGTAADSDGYICVDSPAAPCLIITGSGSTGLPKYFAIKHEHLLARVRLTSEVTLLSPSDRVASLSHLDYLTSKVWWFAALFAGGSVASVNRVQIDPTLIREEFGITVLSTGVVHLENMLAAVGYVPESRKTSLRALFVAGSTVSDGLRQRISDHLTSELWIIYGTNEMGILTLIPPSGMMKVPGTVGYPAVGVQVEIVDAQGGVLERGRTGHVRVRTSWMIDGYLNDEQATKETIRNGWFYPGDMGRLSEDGQLIYCGRSDHMMNMNGINIYPAEIELTMSQHEAVHDVAVMPLYSAVHQDVPVCALTLHPSSKVSEKELYEFAHQRLGSRMPRFIFVVPEIPRNPQGKLVRARLKEVVEEKLRQKQGGIKVPKPQLL